MRSKYDHPAFRFDQNSADVDNAADRFIACQAYRPSVATDSCSGRFPRLRDHRSPSASEWYRNVVVVPYRMLRGCAYG